jgi:hypothetical protein
VAVGEYAAEFGQIVRQTRRDGRETGNQDSAQAGGVTQFAPMPSQIPRRGG